MENTEQENVTNTEQQEVPSQPSPMDFSAPDKKTSWGPVIGLIIILALIIVGSLYFLMQDQKDPTTNENDQENIEEDINNLRAQGSSDELADIEADLESTDFDNIDSDLNLAEEEF